MSDREKEKGRCFIRGEEMRHCKVSSKIRKACEECARGCIALKGRRVVTGVGGVREMDEVPDEFGLR